MRYFHLPPVVSCARRTFVFFSGRIAVSDRGKQAEKRSCEARKPDGRRAGARARSGRSTGSKRYARDREVLCATRSRRARVVPRRARVSTGETREICARLRSCPSPPRGFFRREESPQIEATGSRGGRGRVLRSYRRKHTRDVPWRSRRSAARASSPAPPAAPSSARGGASSPPWRA